MKKILVTVVLGSLLVACGNTKQEVEEPVKEERVEEVQEIVEEKEEQPVSNTSNSDVRAFLDSYESFMNEYVEFMKKYEENPTDITLLGEYADFLTKYNDFVQKMDAYDTDTMSNEDAAYYLEVQARVLKNLSTVL
ncbi:MAG: hypothetical protein Q4C49_04355 [Bacillota bacterium]|nr:hypothetical protein [Bacillota bacterium]